MSTMDAMQQTTAKRRRVRGGTTLATGAALASLALALVAPAQPALADLANGGAGGDVIIGRDDDNLNNPLIQPAGVAANQSLNNADVLRGGPGNDVLIGLLGDDVLLG